MARLDIPALEQSAFDKMPSGWVSRTQLETLLTQDEFRVVVLHATKQRTRFVGRVKTTSVSPYASELQYQKVVGE